MSQVTEVFSALQRGDARATEDLLPLVYAELRQLAAARLANEAAGHTLQPTALVHEAYLRLVGRDQPGDWNGRGHFFGAAAEAMRRILVDRARDKGCRKRGGGWGRVDLDHLSAPADAPPEHLLDLDAALDRLAAAYPACADLVKLRFFGGLTLDEAADALGLARRTADRQWAFARAWLADTLGRD